MSVRDRYKLDSMSFFAEALTAYIFLVSGDVVWKLEAPPSLRKISPTTGFSSQK